MNTEIGSDPDQAAVANPETAAEQLQLIASRRADLHQAILEHPNTYPALSDWIRAKQVPSSLPAPTGFPAPSGLPAPTGFPAPTGLPAPYGTPSAPPDQKKVKKRKIALILGIAGAVLLLALIGFLVWWFFLRDDGESDSSQAYAALPEIGTVVDVSTFGRDIRIVPIGPDDNASYKSGGLRLVGLRGAPGDAVAAIDLDAGQVLPQWIVPIKATVAQCVLEGEILDCDTQSYHVTAQAPVPTKAAKGRASLQPARPQSVLVGTAADGALDYGLTGGDLIDESGDTIVELPDSDGPYYGIAPSKKGLPTLISDGRNIVAVKGSKVLWTKTLSAGASQVNGFEEGQEPSWKVEGEVLLVAEPGGVMAVDIATGEELWRIDTPVVSWQADQGSLVISQGTSVVVLPFPDDDQGKPADPSQPEDAKPGGKQLVIGEAQGVPELPTADELLDSYIELPPSCQDESGLAESRSVFESGVVNGDQGTVVMTGAGAIVMAGELATVMSFECRGQGGDPVPAVAAYDMEMEMLQELSFWDDLAVMPWMLSLDGVRGEGSAAQIVVSAEGGKLCPDCSSDAQVEMLWDGSNFVTTRVGDPPANWRDLGNAVEILVGDQFVDGGSSEAAGLSPADLANIELSLPMAPGVPDSPYVTRSFQNYFAEDWDGGAVDTQIVADEIFSAVIGGEPFLFAPIWTASDGYGGSLIGSICAISADAVAYCAPIPEGLGTSFIAAADLTVSGNEVTYALYTESEIPVSWITQSFDGERFTLISDNR